jgi:small subunit ribosomal protein S17
MSEITVSPTIHHRTLKGKVVSVAMQKTVVVAVSRIKSDPLYKKRYNVTKRYMAHCDKENVQIGDEVTIQETRPMSKHKRWIVIT